MKTYDDALGDLVLEYKKPIAFLFRLDESEVDNKELKTMLEYSMGIQLQSIFEFKGTLGIEAVRELQRLPVTHRSSETAQKSLERAEFQHVQNRSLDKIKAPEKKRNHLAEHLSDWRKVRMRKEMRALTQEALVVEIKTRQLTLALDQYRHSPSQASRHLVCAAVIGLNRALVKSHARARIAGAWAIRAGFSSHSAGRALEHLYFKRARRLEKSTMRLDQWLEQNSFKARVSPGISRRRLIMEAELNRALAMDANVPEIAYPAIKHSRPRMEFNHAP